MDAILVDGTYELFRYFFALPSHVTADGREVAATRGVLGDVLNLVEAGATHVGVATDHVIESWRNEVWNGYKTGDGIDAALAGQFGILEDGLQAMGVCVWPMVEREADDALASAAQVCAADPSVGRVVIRTVDKDLAQCVVDPKVVQYDRRKDVTYDEAGIRDKFGVVPASIPDYLALVGDTADGFPGLRGWGAKSASAVLARYLHLEDIPAAAQDWDISVRGAATLAATLAEQMDDALVFRDLATLRPDPPVVASVTDLEWHAPGPAFTDFCKTIDGARLAEKAAALRPG